MRNIRREDVIRLFLKYESGKKRFLDMESEIISWCLLPNTEMIKKAKEFAMSRPDVPPVWIYTGCFPSDDRSNKVVFWSRENVECDKIYTNGIGRHMANDLESSNWNMKYFAKNYADKYLEFKSFRNIPKDRQTVILVKKIKDGKHGTYELIDGSHRLVGMILEGCKIIPAFVAHLK